MSSSLPSVYFGWTSAKPPEYQIKLMPTDLKGTVANDAFVRKVADHLYRSPQAEGLKAAGFVNLSNLSLLNKNIHAFFNDLIPRVCEKYVNQYSKDVHIRPDEQVLVGKHVIDGKAFTNADAVVDEQGRQWTGKMPHLDGLACLVGHYYPSTKNVEGGDLQIYDIRQYLADHPGKKLSDITKGTGTGRQALMLTPEELKPYCITIKRDTHKPEHPAIALFNNTYQNTITGVAHGATPVSIRDQNQAFYRGYHRISFTKKRSGTIPPGVTVTPFAPQPQVIKEKEIAATKTVVS